MSWLQDIFKKGAGSPDSKEAESEEKPRALDILVTRGPDLGKRFSLDADEVLIGRGTPRPGQPGDVLLSDRHISRSQAMMRQVDGNWTIEHLAGSKSPTKVNGKQITSCALKASDQIEIGQDVLVLQASNRSGLSTLSLKEEEETTDPNLTLPSQLDEAGTIVAGAQEFKPPPKLHVLTGHSLCEGEYQVLKQGLTSVGRSQECDFTIREPSISRKHVDLLNEDGKITLVHLSTTNPTIVNGELVEGAGTRRELAAGDELAICEAVVLKLEKDGILSSPTKNKSKTSTGSVSSLSNNMRKLVSEQERLELLREELEARFQHTGSFLDIDVVDSTGLKAGETNPAYIIVSFDTFRVFIGNIVKEFGGQVLNSNGDELMCFFPLPLEAVYCAEAIQERLAEFNAKENKLKRDFQTRIGIHSGTSLVDLRRGKAYSNILDVAGHLQKASEVGSYLISKETLDKLPPEMPFECGPGMTKSGLQTFRPCAPLPGRDSISASAPAEN